MSAFRHLLAVVEPRRPACCGSLAQPTLVARPWERGCGVEYRCKVCGQGYDGQRLALPRRAA